MLNVKCKMLLGFLLRALDDRLLNGLATLAANAILLAGLRNFVADTDRLVATGADKHDLGNIQGGLELDPLSGRGGGLLDVLGANVHLLDRHIAGLVEHLHHIAGLTLVLASGYQYFVINLDLHCFVIITIIEMFVLLGLQ